MLSKKMAFLLIHLITMFVYAFSVPSTMAEFGVTMSVNSEMDVSAEGGIQVIGSTSVAVRVNFDKVIQTGTAATDFSANDITVIAYNAFGGVEPAPRLTDPVVYDPNNPDGRNFMVRVSAPSAEVTSVFLYMGKHKVEVADPRADVNNDGTRRAAGKSAEAFITIHYVKADGGDPQVYSIRKSRDPFLPVTARTVSVFILLSEKPKAFTKNHVSVSNATYGDPIAWEPLPAADDMPSTGRDDRLYSYILTIMPNYPVGKPNIIVKVKAFDDQVHPSPNRYIPPATETGYRESIDKLTIRVGKEDLTTLTARLKFHLPEKRVIPGNGYLVVAKDKAGSAVHVPPGAVDVSPAAHERRPVELKYNIIDDGNLPNLETFFVNGGVIDVMSPHALVISEVMWGLDASLTDDPSKSQWIELYNAGAAYTTAKEDATTSVYESVTLVFYSINELSFLPPLNADGTLPAGVTDRIGTIDAGGIYWSLAGKGQSGRTGADEAVLTAAVPTQPIISMYRITDASGKVADGRIASSWRQSEPPNLNFDRNRISNRVGSPGAGRIISEAELAARAAAERAKSEAAAKAAAAKAANTFVSLPRVGQIYISEVMFAGGGSLPQWIEIANGSRTERVDLGGWTLTVENATADADVSVSSIIFTIPEGTRIDPSGQHATPSTILVVTELGRHNLNAGRGRMGKDQIISLWAEQRSALIDAGVTKFRYSLLSGMAFKIMLAPAALITTPADATDVVGNLGADGTAAWELPMNESGARSSILRRHFQAARGPAAPRDGTLIDSWVLASDTGFAQVTHIRASNYYGLSTDVGTPGFRAGGALPVELSHFRPVRDKETGAVVITWSTQSELNNAGFFIKRSQQKDGEFKVINAAMIAGAGTTSEKQFYTYTDTAAQANVVYYYQIKDVSLDGNHRTLTRGVRLKGHIGAAGKLTTTWGDLKTSQ